MKTAVIILQFRVDGCGDWIDATECELFGLECRHKTLRDVIEAVQKVLFGQRLQHRILNVIVG